MKFESASTLLFAFFITANILCLSSDSTKRLRIVGGQTVRHRIVSYQISLQVKVESKSLLAIVIPFVRRRQPWEHICGGSIIAKNYVLTAAHCVADFSEKQMSVLSGTRIQNSGGKRHLIEWILTHPDYKELVTSDIAIIKIQNQFLLNRNINKIGLSEAFVKGGKACVLTGWGYLFPIRLGDISNRLQTLKMKTLTNGDCSKRGLNVTSTEICAYRSFLRGACGGDSGGPLANTAGTILIGIVSYGTAVCGIGVPDAFTRVSVFVPWINSIIEKDVQQSTTIEPATSDVPLNTKTTTTTEQIITTSFASGVLVIEPTERSTEIDDSSVSDESTDISEKLSSDF